MISPKRVAVIGSTGQLGGDVVEVFSHSGCYEVTSFPHARLDVTNRERVGAALLSGSFDIVVNCAAFTRVDECEERPQNALLVNGQGGFEVARASAKAGSLCVFISTDFVFDGKKGSPYTEEDQPAPINVYGVSKLAGEYLVAQAASRWLILRISSVFGKLGSRGKGGNFVESILSKARAGETLRVIGDIWMSPSYTMDVARTLDELIQSDASGLYHAANAGRCSWYDFAREVTQMAGLNPCVEPISSADYPASARRPQDSSLKSLRLGETLGHALPSWEDALWEYLVEKGHVKE